MSRPHAPVTREMQTDRDETTYHLFTLYFEKSDM